MRANAEATPAILRCLMEGRLVLKDCSIIYPDGRLRSEMAVLIEQGRISKVASDREVPILPGDWEVACRGRLVVPGLVDSHAHLVGGQLVPRSSEFLPKPGPDQLEVQQQMESHLGALEVEALTAFAIARALRSGVTTLVEHLRCPSDVGGGLGAQLGAAERLGVRFINSHATNSRSGPSSAAQQVEANAAQAEARKRHPLVRCALGFDASSACDDDLLGRLGRLRQELSVGVHGHVGEDDDDLARSLSEFKERIVPRLDRHGLLGRACIAGYACAIDRSESVRLAETETAVALSPSRCSIEEPGGGWESVAGLGTIALGTAGSISLWDEAGAAFASLLKAARLGRPLDPDGLLSKFLLRTPSELCSQIFGEPIGAVEPGNQADLVVYDLVPFPDAAEGPARHWLLQMARSSAAWTIIAGQVVVREGQLLAHDYLELAREAERARSSVASRAGADFSVQASSRGARRS